MRPIPAIMLYGTEGCNKTKYYRNLFNEMGIPYQFLDVDLKETYAIQLRALYESGKLNYPTITIGKKRLRNPRSEELLKWINKLIPQRLKLFHDKDRLKYTLDINGEEARIEYIINEGIMHLTYSEVPTNLRGRGIGKELTLKTFEKLTEEGYRAVAVCSFIQAVKNSDPYWKTTIQ